MQSADVFAEDPGFMLKVRQWAQEQGGSVGEDGAAQICRPAGRLLTVYEGAYSLADWHVHDAPVAGRGGPVPDLSAMPSSCAIECRWKDWFVEAISELAERAVGAVWVLDNNGVVWSARDIDADRLQL